MGQGKTEKQIRDSEAFAAVAVILLIAIILGVVLINIIQKIN